MIGFVSKLGTAIRRCQALRFAPATRAPTARRHLLNGDTFYSAGTIGAGVPLAARQVSAKPKLNSTPFHQLRFLAVGAFALVGIFVVGFGVWSVYAPLESAAIAGGAIEAESSRKTIQHLEGGIVGRILVNDGDEVAPGQPLIQLDDMRAQANVLVLQMQLWEAQALEARLLAERDGREHIKFPRPSGQVTESNPEFATIMAGQTKIFDTRRNFVASQIEVIEQRKAQTEQEIEGLRSQKAATAKRAEIIKKEVAGVAPLVAKGLQTRGRLLRLEREQAEIDGRSGDLLAKISQAEQSIGESQAMIFKLESDHYSEIAQSMRETQALISQLTERIQAANDVLARTVIRAPEAGTVTDLRIHTPGGVVAAGEPLLDLVPRQDRLIVRALVKPEDIDLVRSGLEARVRLLSYKHRRVPPVDGVLTYVSADSLVDKETQRPYYTARVRIDEASLNNLPEVEIMPGMPVEVMIKTGEFTVAHYMLRPVLDSFNRAFRED
jgi:HlyD family secretion protein